MVKKTESPEKTSQKDLPETSEKEAAVVTYYEGIGRRRESTARVRLYVVNDGAVEVRGKSLGKSDMMVNGRTVESYFPGDIMKKLYLEPFRTTNTIGRFAVSITTSGGGLRGQLGAVVLGVSRALEKVDKEKFRPILKKKNFLTRDARSKERRKAGLAHKARKKKQSPKR